MTGILLWKEKTAGTRQRAITLQEMRVLQKPFLCASVLWEERLPVTLLRRRMLAAAKKLKRAGVKELILPAEGGGESLAERLEMEIVCFPGEKLPKLPSAAKLVVRPYNPKTDEPTWFYPDRLDAGFFRKFHKND